MAANGNQIVNIPQGFFDSKEEATEVISSIRNPQDEDDRRRIRENYRKLQDDLLERRREMIDPSDEQNLLKENVFKVDQMFKEVQMTREGALDSASLANISELGKAKAQALKTDFIQFNPVDFCEKVKVIIAGDVDQQGLSYENWKTLGKAVFPFFKRTPVLKYMCGTFERGDVNLKRAKPTREKEKENVLSQKASKPTQLSSFEDTDRGELTTAHVEHILSTLWRYYDEIKAPLCYFEFVTNPHSFGQTVENIFYTSFLVRDGHASVTLDTDDLPVIEPIQKADGGANQEQTHKQQIIISITPSEWEEIVKTFEIHTPMIESLKRTEASSRQSTVTNSPEIPVYQGKGKANLD